MRFYYKNLFNKKNKDFLAIFSSNLFLLPINILKGFFVAKYLGPSSYGFLKSLELIQMLNKYGNIGFKLVASREVANQIGKQNFKKANIVRETNYSAEFLLSVFLFLICSLLAIFANSTEVSLLILISSFSLFIRKIQGILLCETGIQKKFILYAKNSFFTGLFISIIVILFVPYYKIYAILFTDIFVIFLSILYLIKNLDYTFMFKIHSSELTKSFKNGIPLTLSSLSFASFKYSERLLILFFLDTYILGLFSFAIMIINNLSILIKSLLKVRVQDIWELLGSKKFKEVNDIVIKETIISLSLALIFITIVYFFIEIIIVNFLPDWSNAISLSKYSLILLPIILLPNYFGVILNSSVINKLKIPIYGWFLSTLFLIISSIHLDANNLFNIENFIFIYLLSNSIYSIIILYSYKKYFYDVYIKR